MALGTLEVCNRFPDLEKKILNTSMTTHQKIHHYPGLMSRYIAMMKKGFQHLWQTCVGISIPSDGALFPEWYSSYMNSLGHGYIYQTKPMCFTSSSPLMLSRQHPVCRNLALDSFCGVLNGWILMKCLSPFLTVPRSPGCRLQL